MVCAGGAGLVKPHSPYAARACLQSPSSHSSNVYPRGVVGKGIYCLQGRNGGKGYRRVIPNHFSKSLHITASELNQSWCVCSTCGFMKPDKMSLSCIVWLPGYGPLKIHL